MKWLLDVILITVIVLIVGAAALYIYKEKKKGVKCIGCPYAKQCGGGCCGGGAVNATFLYPEEKSVTGEPQEKGTKTEKAEAENTSSEETRTDE